MMSESMAEMRRLESWPNNKPAISPSAFAWVKIGLGRMPLVGLGVGLTLLELVLIGLFLGIHAGFIFYSYRRSNTEHFAKSLGEVVHWDLALSLLFVTRNSIWQVLFSCSFERAIAYHRWISNTAIAVVIAHGTVFHVTWLKEGRQKWIDEALKKTDNLFGEVAVACYLVVIAMSLPFVRRRLFELFRWAHIIFVPSFIVFILLHHGGGGFLMKASVSLFFYGVDLLYRLYSILISPKSRAAVVSAQKVCSDIVKLTIKVDGRFAYSAGQYVFLTLPAVAPLQAHPFTISSAPPAPGGGHDGEFTVHVKSAGNYTHQLLRAVEMRPGTIASGRVEGPYGALSVDPFAYRRVVLVAGGIGVTPMLAIMRHMHDRGAPLADKVSLHWSVPHLALYLAFSNDMKLDSGGVFESHVYVTRADPGDEATAQGAGTVDLHLGQGRPDLAGIIADEVRQAWPDRVAVLVCGPESMRAQVTGVCGRHPGSVDLHAETFEL